KATWETLEKRDKTPLRCQVNKAWTFLKNIIHHAAKETLPKYTIRKTKSNHHTLPPLCQAAISLQYIARKDTPDSKELARLKLRFKEMEDIRNLPANATVAQLKRLKNELNKRHNQARMKEKHAKVLEALD